MSDLISRQAAIDELKKYIAVNKNPNHDARIWEEGMNCAVSVIGSLPSAQPEIIRCKDCRHSEHWYGDKRRCFLWHETGIDVFEDGYCNYAERRTDGQTD